MRGHDVQNDMWPRASTLRTTPGLSFPRRYLSYTLNSTLIRKQDASFVITGVATTRLGHSLAWDFVREHWEYMFTE